MPFLKTWSLKLWLYSIYCGIRIWSYWKSTYNSVLQLLEINRIRTCYRNQIKHKRLTLQLNCPLSNDIAITRQTSVDVWLWVMGALLKHEVSCFCLVTHYYILLEGVGNMFPLQSYGLIHHSATLPRCVTAA